MTPEDMKAAGLTRVAMLMDEEAAELVDDIEAILLTATDTPTTLAEQLARARLDGFVYGYRLGARPRDTKPSDPSERINE